MITPPPNLNINQKHIKSKLQDLDTYIEKLLEDWNAPGVGLGIVSGDKLVFSKGYGYRDYGKKLPITEKTLWPIASNSKLFTAVAAGLLVEEGKLTWDKPIRDKVPSLRFHSNELNSTVTLRDMLAHRTGITRHDCIWYQSDFTCPELFERTKYLNPVAPLRQEFIYNNLMYAAAGHIIELQSGKTWEQFVRDEILTPLDMHETVYTIENMVKHADHAVPFTERRDSTDLYQIPFYEDFGGIAPCGSINSNIEEMSHWLGALMNDGKYANKQVIPPGVLKSTLEPAIAIPNVQGETRGWWEIINPAYGMGRLQASYRGHPFTYHGGAIDGFHSQVSYLPQEKLGVIVFAIGDHCGPQLRDIITYNVYERFLGLSETPWSDRLLDVTVKQKRSNKEARSKAGVECVANTKPSHGLADYVGDYEHPAYGLIKIELEAEQLQFKFNKLNFHLHHFHYDRFDTPDHERYGKMSLNFLTNPQGDIDKAAISLDQAEVTFVRKPEALEPDLLRQLAGTYKTPAGARIQIIFKDDDSLLLAALGQPDKKLTPYKGLVYRVENFSDMTFEFIMENDKVEAIQQVCPAGVFEIVRCQ